jgi:hypothetical protein
VPGFAHLGQAHGEDQWGQYRREDDPILVERQRQRDEDWRRSKHRGGGQPVRAAPPADVSAKARAYAAALTPEARRRLAEALGLPEPALAALPLLGYSPRPLHREYVGGCWTFPEVNSPGAIVGLTCRYGDGRKPSLAGGHRGLTVVDGWAGRPGPVFLPEGATCTLTLAALGLCGVGRPNNTGGVEDLADLLRPLPPDRPIVVLAEYDPNDK